MERQRVSTIRGRGISERTPGRYARQRVEADGDPPADAWDHDAGGQPDPATEFVPETVRSVIARNSSPDLPFRQSVNPYRGCEHGCVYCYARPYHAWLDLSPGLDFERHIRTKPGAARQLRRELARPGYRCEPIALGTGTDGWQPGERRLGLSRQILTVLRDFRHPVSIITKSALVERDLDLLQELATHGLVSVMISVTTLDDELKRRLEPRTPAGSRRLEIIRRLSRAGVPCGVMVAPVIPALNDHEIEAILAGAAAAGATSAAWALLRLPDEVEALFTGWLRDHYPLRAERVLALLRDCRGGQLDDARFGSRFRGQGPYAALLRARFRTAARRLGLAQGEGSTLNTAAFRVPPAPGTQLDLLA